MKIEDMISQIIKVEGGYVDHPNDRGGPTCWGITQQVARAWGYQGDMRDLSQETARRIYLERYWLQPKFNEIAMRDPALAEELADTGVNMGTAVASKFLQRALNVLNKGGSAYPDIEVDGGIGKMTLYALDQLIAARGVDGLRVLKAMCNAQQSVRYIEIAEGRSSQEDFEFGWQLNRVANQV